MASGSSSTAAQRWFTSCNLSFAAITTWKNCGAIRRAIEMVLKVQTERRPLPQNTDRCANQNCQRSSRQTNKFAPLECFLKTGVAEAFPSKAAIKKEAAIKCQTKQQRCSAKSLPKLAATNVLSVCGKDTVKKQPLRKHLQKLQPKAPAKKSAKISFRECSAAVLKQGLPCPASFI